VLHSDGQSGNYQSLNLFIYNGYSGYISLGLISFGKERKVMINVEISILNLGILNGNCKVSNFGL
jgi:hypothetical protein